MEGCMSHKAQPAEENNLNTLLLLLYTHFGSIKLINKLVFLLILHIA